MLNSGFIIGAVSIGNVAFGDIRDNANDAYDLVADMILEDGQNWQQIIIYEAENMQVVGQFDLRAGSGVSLELPRSAA